MEYTSEEFKSISFSDYKGGFAAVRPEKPAEYTIDEMQNIDLFECSICMESRVRFQYCETCLNSCCVMCFELCPKCPYCRGPTHQQSRGRRTQQQRTIELLCHECHSNMITKRCVECSFVWIWCPCIGSDSDVCEACLIR